MYVQEKEDSKCWTKAQLHLTQFWKRYGLSMKTYGMESICCVAKISKEVLGAWWTLKAFKNYSKRFLLFRAVTVNVFKCIKECRNLQFMFMFKFILFQVEDSGLAHY